MSVSRGQWAAVVFLVLVVAGWWWLREVLPPSLRALEQRAADRPGVARVVAEDPGGDDAIPFQRLARGIEVAMDPDATAAQVKDVLHAYDDDIDDGDIGAVTVRVTDGDGTDASLTLGQTIHVDDATVDEMFGALTDPTVRSYDRSDTQLGPEVRVELEPTSLATVSAYVERYRQVGDVAIISVGSGELVIDRDRQWGPRAASLSERRERAALRLDERLGLDGVLVADQVPLIVRLAEHADRAIARDYLVGLPEGSDVGWFRVTGP